MTNEYPADWDQRRRKVYAEDGYQCQNCGRKGGPHGNTELHAHHIVPKSRGGTHAKSNLVTVCKGCHSAIHGTTSAPTQQSLDLDRWTEITGSIIDDSKQLTVDVDDHMGRVYDAISETPHEDEFDLVDQNPVGDNQLWNEKEDLRRRFYNIKAMADERKQHKNEVTPTPVKNAISQYITSFENYVKSTIEIWTFFEKVSEEDGLSAFQCPNCDEGIEKDSQFCRYCGSEVDSNVVEDQAESEQFEQQWEKLRKRYNQSSDKIQLDMIKMDIEMNAASPDETSVSWDYCPNCGFENSVWLDNSRAATCLFCQAQWEKKGLLFTKWKMVEGEYVGDSVADTEWEDRGRSKNRDRTFEELLKVHH